MDVINSLLRAARAGNLKRVIEFVEDDLVDINSSNQNGLTALHSASKEGHTHIVEELISRGANVHAKTLKGNTALHIASLAGHEPVVRVLIENGADVDAQSASGFTALYMAAQENHEPIVKLLLANGANQNIATTDGFTPLAVAMQQGHEQIASILLNNEAKGRIRFPGTTESGRSLLHIAAKKDDCAAAALLIQNNISPDITSKSGFTALHVACHYGNEAVAKLLIDRQADVNFQAKHNITPVHVAAKWGQEHLVELLLDNRAKIDATTRDGLTPLHCAARSGHDAVVELLIRRGAPISAKTRSGLAPLHMATQGDHLKSAQILLNNRAPVDDVTVDYLTALHVASHCGHVKVAKLLLNNKADPNFRALNGFTSLHIACKKNRVKIVELLLKYGASLNAVTESGLTPLHVASFMGCVQIVIYLLDNHANIESVTVRGETPLHLATRANQIEVIKVLLRYGANVSARAKESQTALHIASRLGNADIAKLLIEQGIDVDAPTKDSYTALHIAAKEGHEAVVILLLNHGADISCATRNHGFTPLHLASKYGIDNVVDLLLRYGAPVDAQGKNGVTPLHVATHYDHPSVVELLLLDRGPRLPGASPHAMAKNGYTALHIAAKGNRIDIANAILQHGANPNAESKAGFCPLHLAAQEGRTDMAALLLNNGAIVNCRAKNGITPLHLCAQEDHVNVAQLLVKRGAHLDAQTKGGFTPLHVASHFARLRMIRFLLANGANVNIPAASGYTPLHQASQQGNPQIVELLLQYSAKPDALTENGQTALSIAENLGYVSVIETLRVVTEMIVKTTTTTITEEKFKIVAPETMQETFVSDSEDEDVMKGFNNMTDDNYNTSQSNLVAEQQQQQLQSAAAPASQQQRLNEQPRRVVEDEMSQDLQYLSREAPLDGGESTFGAYSQLGGTGSQRDEQSMLRLGSDDQLHFEEGSSQRFGTESPYDQQQLITSHYALNDAALEQLAPDNVDIQRPLQQAGPIEHDTSEQLMTQTDEANPSLLLKPFLVSFMVDARGGAMRGCRHSGVRVIIPPNTAPMPMRITCRYLRRERLVHPPPLMEGEACASKIMEVGPAGAKFLGPVLIEVPHFASLRGKEREIIILRSDSGEVWREHLVESDARLIESIIKSAEAVERQHDAGGQENVKPADAGAAGGGGGETSDDQLQNRSKRLTRIVTNEFPQYFAIISRIRQEVHTVGPEGSTVDSQVVPRVQAIFTEGALTKRIKIGLQPKSKKQQQQDGQQQHQDQQQHQQDAAHAAEERAQSPSSQDEQQQDPLRPQSATSQHSGARPGSSAAKRRSRFLACFGAGQGSLDLLDQSATSEASSAGGESPRQPASEKMVERRHILEDVSDSEGEAHSSPSLGSAKHQQPTAERKKRQAESQLVPDNYYIEQEPPLILNIEPTTYGKRLASSSAQTDQKLQMNGFMSTSTRKNKKRGGGLLGGGKRRNKTQLTIHCEPVPPATRPKSADLGVADSSLDTETDHYDQQHKQLNDTSSIIQDVITSDDHKWRTCTIQTDSDSVTVNYVTIHSDGDQVGAGSVAAATQTGAGSGQDDGYVSGSGELKKEPTSSFGKGLFSPFCASAGNDEQDDDDSSVTEKDLADTKRARKQRAKAAKKQQQRSKNKPQETNDTKTLEGARSGQSVPVVGPSIDNSGQQQQDQTIKSGADVELAPPVAQEAQAGSGGEEADESLTTTTRSISPTSKELKQKLKLERQEKLKREKLEKQRQKELDEAAAKAEKAKRKADKEAKKKAEKLEKAQKAAAKKMGSQSPTGSKPETPQPAAASEIINGESQSQPVASVKVVQSVKFASELVEKDVVEPTKGEIGSLDRVIDSRQQPDEKLRAARSAGQHGVAVKEPTDATNELVVVHRSEQQLISLSSDSESAQPVKLTTSQQLNYDEPQTTVSSSETTNEHVSVPNLKPILKQQQSTTSSSFDEPQSAEIVIREQRTLSSVASNLVNEATDEAVRAADAHKAAVLSSGGDQSPTMTSSLSESKKEASKRMRAEKERLKKEAKAKLEEEKRVSKETKRRIKEAEAEAIRVAEEAEKARKVAEAQAKMATEEAKKAANAAKRALGEVQIEQELAKALAEDVNKAAEAETKRLDKQEAERKLKLDRKQQKLKRGTEALAVPSIEPIDSASELDTSKSEPVSKSFSSESTSKTGAGRKPTIDDSSSSSEDDEAQKEDKKKTKTKDKKVKKTKRTDDEAPPSSGPASESASKSSFLRRLFRGKRSAPSELATAHVASEQIVATKKAKEAEPIIVSEMYPSDPNNADGEMILEINVPQNLVWVDPQQEQQQQQQQQQLTANTTIDSEQDNSFTHGNVTTTTTNNLDQEDQEATLVNISQMADEDEATENVISQANDSAQDILGQAEQMSPQSIRDDPNWTAQEGLATGTDQQVVIGRGQKMEPDEETSGGASKSQTAGASSDKNRKELEVKLEKAAKRRAKEEEKLRKKQESEAKRLADAEAKRQASEEKERLKREAKEAKRLAELAKKQAKEDKQKAKKLKSIKTSEQAASADTAESSGPAARSSTSGEPQPQTTGEISRTTVTTTTQDGEPIEQLDTTNMTPINTETEVERIVEEVVSEDGTVTKTTKTIETKYVTMRQEEVRMAERRDIPVEEWERIQKADRELDSRAHKHRARSGSSSSSSSSSASKWSVVVETAVKRGPFQVPAYEHPELDEIRSTPSYFGPDKPAELQAMTKELSPRKELKKRFKLNERLIKRAKRLAQRECKRAKKEARKAGSEIAVCEEAARQARVQLKRAAKEAKRAAKAATKEHKKMDKIDKKLAKGAKKLEKHQRKLDKRASKLAKKEARRQEKAAKKGASELEKRSSGSSKGSKKSIKLEDIGEPVLRSSSRLSISRQPADVSSEMVSQQQQGTVITGRGSPPSDDIQVDMSLDDGQLHHKQQAVEAGQVVAGQEQQQQAGHDDQDGRMQIRHTITRTVITEGPDGESHEETSKQVLSGAEAEAAALVMELEAAREEDEQIDVVGDLQMPQINKNRKQREQTEQ